jgi:hypothetical protein
LTIPSRYTELFLYNTLRDVSGNTSTTSLHGQVWRRTSASTVHLWHTAWQVPPWEKYPQKPVATLPGHPPTKNTTQLPVPIGSIVSESQHFVNSCGQPQALVSSQVSGYCLPKYSPLLGAFQPLGTPPLYAQPRPLGIPVWAASAWCRACNMLASLCSSTLSWRLFTRLQSSSTSAVGKSMFLWQLVKIVLDLASGPTGFELSGRASSCVCSFPGYTEHYEFPRPHKRPFLNTLNDRYS